jgi:preprotein translocase subunit Sss1
MNLSSDEVHDAVVRLLTVLKTPIRVLKTLKKPTAEEKEKAAKQRKAIQDDLGK